MKQNQIRNLETAIFERFEREAQARKELEKHMLALIDQRVSTLRQEIHKESKIRYESVENLEACLEVSCLNLQHQNDFPKLQEELRSTSNAREESDNLLFKHATEESNKIADQVTDEKKNRESTEEAILDMLREMINKIKGEIETERKEREQSEETLLGLLEETCAKLNNATIA